MLLPLILIISVSFTNELTLSTEGYRFIPSQFSLAAYKTLFEAPGILLNAYGVTILVTVLGTACGLLLTSMLAYTISRPDYRYRRITTLFVFFTMLFNGGLVPFYILITQYLHLKDTLGALILPYLISPFLVMVMKGFLEKIPLEIIESAKMDGASEFRIFFTLILPLSTPALATVGLFISFTYWNDWWLGLLFIDAEKLVPLQLLLYRVMNSIEFLRSNTEFMSTMTIDMSQFPNLSARMAMAILGAGPMLFIFPFFQKYFVRGLTVGSLKG
ncbi:carbohydrate ABC transporter permease [Paenibacillus radicis (ex Xue et al. 2023)]|uniref:Carbohydrate ABC transporter permease n=2 Tax=Paenibacillus TaxID=44249 RepID=A0ABT1YAV8_9BACL|nr:carbohydrate ABC transporter permease [Paenibacillus radicis (ex Xue et al. 2023)]MCR8630324.1 carbohydrate ABC transporter permease [Paenibacillus radicis (ex Xue et al. 2023)]